MPRINPNKKEKEEEYDLNKNNVKNEKEYILNNTEKDNSDVANTMVTKMANAIGKTTPTTNKNIGFQDLEVPGAARVAVLDFLDKNKDVAFTRKEILNRIGNIYPHGSSMHPKYPNKQTWEVLTDWAISNLASKHKILNNKNGTYSISSASSLQNPAINSVVQTPATPTTVNSGVQNTGIPNVYVTKAKKPRKQKGVNAKVNEVEQTPEIEKDEEIKPYKMVPTPIISEVLPENIQAPKYQGNYYAEKELEDILASKLNNKNSPIEIFVGPPGVAKTMAVEVFADKYNLPFTKVQAGPGITENELIGKEVLKSNVNGAPQTEFELGAIPEAIENANKYGTAVLLLDEINALKPTYMKYLNSIRGPKKEARFGNKVWKVNPNSNLIVIATMNPSNFAGTNMLNTELKGGSSTTFITYPSEQVEERILKDIVDDKTLIKNLMLLASFTRQKNTEDNEWYAISPRDEVFTLNDYKGFLSLGIPPEEALKKSLLRFIVNKYMDNPDDFDKAEAVANRIEDIFGIKIKPGTLSG